MAGTVAKPSETQQMPRHYGNWRRSQVGKFVAEFNELRAELEHSSGPGERAAIVRKAKCVVQELKEICLRAKRDLHR
jgi:hypothetical protein